MPVQMMTALKKVNNETDGILLIDKQPGLTSFESLGAVKKALGTRKVGHTGTLDKFASGLLIVLVGRALKLAPWFLGCDKEYEGIVKFGVETDTLDPEGEVIAQGELPSREDVEAVLPGFRGDILQAPPAYSAVHINGKRAHELAREGKAPEMKKRPVTIHELEITSWDPPLAGIRVCCSSGTYIRSLARDIALASGTSAHLVKLRRTRVGGFGLADAVIPDTDKGENLRAALRPASTAVFDYLGLPWIEVDGERAAALVHGKPIHTLIDNLPEGPAAAVFKTSEDGEKKLTAVLERKNGLWAYGHVFSEAL
jgi:tRNA pseudouridine55 synthase